MPALALAGMPAGAPAQAQSLQVAIEARVVELSVESVRGLDVDWRLLEPTSADPEGVAGGALRPGGTASAGDERPAGPGGRPPKGGTIGTWWGPSAGILGVPDLAALLRALEADGRARVLSSPRITARSGEQASVLIGGEIPGTGGPESGSQGFSEFGIRLRFLPVVIDGGRVRLEVTPELSEILSGVADEPSAASRQAGAADPRASTQAELGPGQTMVIGGLIPEAQRSRADPLPGLEALPVLAPLFRSRDFRAGKSDLLIFIEAHALATPGPESAGRAATGGRADCFGSGELELVSLGPKPSALASAAQGAARGLLGGLSGGVVGAGGRGRAGGPRLDRNPFRKHEPASFSFDDGMQIGIQGKRARSGNGTLFGIRIDEEAVKDRGFSFTNVVLVDRDCQQHEPDRRFIYQVRRETRLSFSIEFCRWRDGQLVEHGAYSGSQAWSELLGSGALPLWVGARFDDVTPAALAQGGWTLVTAWTFESDDEVRVQPRVFDLLSGEAAAKRRTAAADVPGLEGVPLLAELFEPKDAARDEVELLVFLTPHLVEGP